MELHVWILKRVNSVIILFDVQIAQVDELPIWLNRLPEFTHCPFPSRADASSIGRVLNCQIGNSCPPSRGTTTECRRIEYRMSQTIGRYFESLTPYWYISRIMWVSIWHWFQWEEIQCYYWSRSPLKPVALVQSSPPLQLPWPTMRQNGGHVYNMHMPVCDERPKSPIEKRKRNLK